MQAVWQRMWPPFSLLSTYSVREEWFANAFEKPPKLTERSTGEADADAPVPARTTVAAAAATATARATREVLRALRDRSMLKFGI
jgi:hypothetical protein